MAVAATVVAHLCASGGSVEQHAARGRKAEALKRCALRAGPLQTLTKLQLGAAVAADLCGKGLFRHDDGGVTHGGGKRGKKKEKKEWGVMRERKRLNPHNMVG